MSEVINNQKWDVVISGKAKISLNLGELYRYRDLLFLFVKRDLITMYKQTILGPLWFLIQPLLTTATYMVIFGRVAKLGTDDIPPALFYLGSVAIWNYFSETLTVTSKTFIDNASIFGKVYFPRIVLPASKVLSGMYKFFIQLAIFLVVWCYHVFVTHLAHPNIYLLLLPVILLLMATISLGLGLLVTSLTTKYRDLNFLISFSVQLLMYLTPVIYPISKFKKFQNLIWLNPLSSLFETFKYGFLGKGTLRLEWLAYTALFAAVTLTFGLIVFNKTEKKSVDTV